MAKDETKYLEEIMNCRSFKSLHGHVIADEMSFSITACLNLSQARPLLLKRVIGPLSGGPTREGLDKLALGGRVFVVNSCLTIAGGTEWLVLMTVGLDRPCLDFLLP